MKAERYDKQLFMYGRCSISFLCRYPRPPPIMVCRLNNSMVNPLRNAGMELNRCKYSVLRLWVDQPHRLCIKKQSGLVMSIRLLAVKIVVCRGHLTENAVRQFRRKVGLQKLQALLRSLWTRSSQGRNQEDGKVGKWTSTKCVVLLTKPHTRLPHADLE